MHACKINHLKLAMLLVSLGADLKAENEEVSNHSACQGILATIFILLCSACLPVCPFSHDSCASVMYVHLLLIYHTTHCLSSFISMFMCMQTMFVRSCALQHTIAVCDASPCQVECKNCCCICFETLHILKFQRVQQCMKSSLAQKMSMWLPISLKVTF